MFLNTTRRIISNSNDSRPNTFMQLRPRTVAPIRTTNNTHHIVAPTTINPVMKWGAPTWTFLHTLAALIKETSFNAIRIDLFRIVQAICTNLPCSICSNHAREYFNKLNVNTIKTKQGLIHMLFAFHNDVNKRKNVELFPLSGLNKYTQGNYKVIANNFMIHYQEKTRNIHLIADEMHRQRVIKTVKQWIIDNIENIELIE